MALCNYPAPPFYPSATLSPSISLRAIPLWHFTSHLTLIPLRTPVGMRTVFPSHFPFLVFYDKDPPPSYSHPRPSSHLPSAPHPQHPSALLREPDRRSPISSRHKSSPKLATNTSAMLIYGSWPPCLSQREAAMVLVGCM